MTKSKVKGINKKNEGDKTKFKFFKNTLNERNL